MYLKIEGWYVLLILLILIGVEAMGERTCYTPQPLVRDEDVIRFRQNKKDVVIEVDKQAASMLEGQENKEVL